MVGASVSIVLLAAAAIMPAAVSAKPDPAVACSLFPGASTVTWKADAKRTTDVVLRWVDADGGEVAMLAIVPTKEMHARLTVPTPDGAAELGVSFTYTDGSSAVAGLGCT